ncbi:MAG: hypothetical protein EOM26_05610 [Alphaproteobacteria bacterium]|nr:hypothetical protein [Alphaproteobacteria bacterium]
MTLQTTEAADLKPDLIPDKFRDAETGEVRLDALVKSYLELEKKLSTMIPAPQGEADRFRLLKMLGLPETPDEYEIDVSHGLFPADPDVNRRLHDKGLTPDQVQEVYNLAAEKMVPMIVELAGDFKAEREVERLVEFFGGPEKWRETSRQLLAFGKKNLPGDVLESLSSTYEGVIALHRMMKAQEPGFAGKTDAAAPPGEKELHSLMRDPKYWRDRDPAMVSKVTEGFKELYGE